jgi:Kef-type K+ transport system membrane component KefB
MDLNIIGYQVIYLAMIFVLLVFPRALQRYRIPAPLTCFALGIATGLFAAEYSNDPTLGLLAALGISSLFLFAGLEVNIYDLKKGFWPLLSHLLIRSLVLGACVWGGMTFFDYSWQVSGLIALAILTPSTGFILDSLSSLGLDEKERFWVTSKAIAGELLALLLLFVILKSDSYASLAISSGILLAIVFGLPLLLILLGRFVIPHAPGSEFSLLVMVGLIAAYLTKQIGVYYLVGAFLAGLAARQLREKMPNLASEENLHAVKLFASFFVPFYFFHGGMHVPEGAFQWEALGLGLFLGVVMIPLRIGSITLQRLAVHGDSAKSGFRVAVALTPTLIFTLVIATILHERFGISDTLFGALLVYAAMSTIFPSLVLSKGIDLDVDQRGFLIKNEKTEPSLDSPSNS